MHQLDERTTYGILQVNVEGTVRTTRAVVPFLITQKRGAIINVSSGSGNHPTPMISCYASTKVGKGRRSSEGKWGARLVASA